MHITFIRPNMTTMRSSDALEPLVFAILAGLTPAEYETVLYDDRLEEIPMDEPTDLVALTVETYTARRAYEIADDYRQRGIRVVMGGYHPSFLPKEALAHADAVVVGDAESVWTTLLEDLCTNQLKQIYRGNGVSSLAGIPYDRTIFKGKRYGPLRLLQWGRGCPFNCDFCSIRAFYGTHQRQRPVAELVAEIEHLNPRHVFLVDDNLFADAAKLEELLLALKPLGITWSTQISINITRKPKLLRLLRESGCASVVIGFESLNPESLQQMKKSWNRKGHDYETAIRIMYDHGIMIYGTFVFGYDGDTPDAFDITHDFALRNRFFLANFNPLTPTPAAPLYDRLKAEQRLIYDPWWLDPNYRYGEATFQPCGMTAQQLTQGCFKTRSKFYEYNSIGRRALATENHNRSLSRLFIYLSANLISKREIADKQGIALGSPARP